MFPKQPKTTKFQELISTVQQLKPYYVIIKWLKEGIILGTTKEIKFVRDWNSQRLKSFI